MGQKAIVIGIVVFLVILVAVPLLFIHVYVPFAFSGGIEGMRRRRIPAPDINSPAIASRRTAMKSDIEAAFNVLDTDTGFTKYVTATHDRCHKGEIGFKTNDPYAHRCELRVTRFYGFNGDFRSQMINFETLLDHRDWKLPNILTIQRIMVEYYDPHYGHPVPPSNGNGGLRYLVSDLPTPTEGYRKNNLTLQIVYVEKDTVGLFQLDEIQKISDNFRVATHNNKEFQDMKSVFQNITQSCKYVLAVSIHGTYFEH